MRQPVCILREREGLVALVLPEALDAPGLLRVPLQELSEKEAPGRTALLASWEALAQARGATVETLVHVLQVLLATVPGDEAPPRSLGHPWLEPPPVRPRRTAAHPRGYRGTIHQPPKKPRPTVLDVRPYLLHRRTLGALLEPLRPHVPEAVQLLEAQGYSRARLALVVDSRGAEPPASFVRLGCLLASGSERGFQRLLALRGRLALETHAGVMTAAARLLSRWGAEVGLPWLEVAAQLAPEAQRELLVALIAADVPPFDASRYDLGFEPFASRQASWRVSYLRGLAAGLPSDYLLSGFRLLDAHGLDSSLSLPVTSGPVPEECITALLAHLRPVTSERFVLADLWSSCGELPGFAEVLTSTPWTDLTPDAASQLVWMVMNPWRDFAMERPVRLRRWSAVRRLLPRLLLQLSRTPASHQARCIDTVSSLVVHTATPWEGPAHLVPSALALAERSCRPPFSHENLLSRGLGALAAHRVAEIRQRVLAAPDRSFLRFERCCAQGQLEILVGEGMRWLVVHDTALVLEAFEAFPEVLARTARLLGTLWRHVTLSVLADFARHPLVREDPFQLPSARMVSVLREHCVEGVESPLPRKARLAWEAGRELPPGQRARALRVASEQLPRLRLQVLARMVLERLRGELPANLGDEGVRHALQLSNLLTENRRALRRLLVRYFAGERDFIVRHPVSRSWFERHPRVDREKWLSGPVLRREVPGVGDVTLSLEQDVLEALRLGTLVGTCFGLNGVCDYSAAAVVLDVNKRVLYARDSRGRVIARQLLAISDDDTLVPFRVYPESTPQLLQSLFLDYDLAFAEVLGLPLCDGPTEPDVENVLSNAFWHDGAWELGAPPPESAGDV